MACVLLGVRRFEFKAGRERFSLERWKGFDGAPCKVRRSFYGAPAGGFCWRVGKIWMSACWGAGKDIMANVAHVLSVGKIEEGFVLDHIRAGRAMKIYHYLGLDKLDCPVAIIKNARSGEMGKKDILKVECDINSLDLDVLAFIDRNITVNVIKDGQIIEKRSLKLPKEIRDVIHCSNPRCISSVERGLPHIFYLADEKTATYRCKYCDEKYEESDSEKYL